MIFRGIPEMFGGFPMIFRGFSDDCFQGLSEDIQQLFRRFARIFRRFQTVGPVGVQGSGVSRLKSLRSSGFEILEHQQKF